VVSISPPALSPEPFGSGGAAYRSSPAQQKCRRAHSKVSKSQVRLVDGRGEAVSQGVVP